MVEVARAAVGKSVAVPLLYVTVPDTSTLPGANNWKVLALIVVGSIASLKVADTVVVVLTFVDAFAGLTAVTEGGVVSGPVLVVKRTSTQ
jgi:hypothetical protein